MSLPVLLAVSDQRWEADTVAALTAAGNGVHVVRRCVDLADLLAATSAGLARAAVVSADLRRLDRDALTRLAACGVAVVGLVPADDEAAERRLRQLGVAHLVSATAAVSDLVEAVRASVGAVTTEPGGATANGWSPPAARTGEPQTDPDEAAAEPGRVVAVWGPTGAPGRSTVAIGVAAELAELGVDTLLVDADAYGGVVAQMLGILDEAPGLAAACRLANNGVLDLAALAELAVQVRPGLRVLTGIARAERWPELRPSGLEVVLGLARSLAAVTVVDCGFSLERDEELSFDTAAPRRNGATLTALADADTVLAVAAADPVGLQRFVRAVGELGDLRPDPSPVTVVNRVRPAAVGGGDAEREIAAALLRFGGLSDVHFVPLDVAACDAAVASGRTLTEAAPTSPARVALRALAARVADVPVPPRRRRVVIRRR